VAENIARRANREGRECTGRFWEGVLNFKFYSMKPAAGLCRLRYLQSDFVRRSPETPETQRLTPGAKDRNRRPRSEERIERGQARTPGSGVAVGARAVG